MNNEAITTDDIVYNYSVPPNVNKKVILLTTGGTAIVGPWKDGHGVIGWHPLPKRNKQLEKELGYDS